jgi:hypothetical protein
MAKRIIKHELIEITIPANTTKTQFKIPEQNNLRNVELLGIQVHVNEITPYSVISQNPTLSQTVLDKCFLNLINYAGFAFLHIIPILTFQTMRHTNGVVQTSTTGGTGGAPEEGGTGGTATSQSTFDDVIYDTDMKDFAGQKTNWPQCFVQFSQDISGDVSVDSVVLISVYYYDPANAKDSDTPFRKMH